jgi:hypothetical protein
MKGKTPTERQILDAKIAPLEERWSPSRENPAIGMDEGILRALARVDDGARRAVQMADDWKGTEVPGNRLDEFFCGLISGKTIKNLASQKKGPEGKHPVGNKKSAYEKWPLTVWFYLRYFCKQEYKGKTLVQISLEEKVFLQVNA